MDKDLVNHNNGAVAVIGPNEVTEYRVHVGDDGLDGLRFGACSLMYVSK